MCILDQGEADRNDREHQDAESRDASTGVLVGLPYLLFAATALLETRK